MKYKKFSYIIAFLLMITIGINNVYAVAVEKCNYVSEQKIAMARLEIYSGYDCSWCHGGKDYSKVFFQKLGNKVDNDKEKILNWYGEFKDTDVTGITLNAIYNGSDEANKNPTCPTYLIVRTKSNYKSYGAFATNDITTAKNFVDQSNKNGEYKAWYLTFKNSDGTKITDEQYYSGFVTTDTIIDKDAKITCTDLFGDKNDAGNEATGEPPSIAYLINQILGYVRIIVPILVIVLGTFDLAQAVIASKEDEMKKAQTTFIKRLILGLVVFFIPVVVNVVMWLADIVWDGMGYTTCEIVNYKERGE